MFPTQPRTTSRSYATMAYTPPGQADAWVFFFQMISGGLSRVR